MPPPGEGRGRSPRSERTTMTVAVWQERVAW
jgi:hypothetical protein